MNETVTRFDGRAGDYASARPSYPDDALDAIFAAIGALPSAEIADVGAGTGISTRLLAARGARAFGIEPNVEMRARALESGLDVRDGTAATTGLATASVDAVTCFQAFHWFATDETVAEFARILRPGGLLALIWNLFDRSDAFTDAFCAILDEYDNPQAIAGLGIDAAAFERAVSGGPFSDLGWQAFPYRQPVDEALVLRRLRSSSSAPRDGNAFEAMPARARELMARFAGPNGEAEIVHRTVVMTARRAA